MTEIKKFKLSSKGLKNVATCHHPDDFKFIVGKKEYKCPSFFADFISPKISHLHVIDPCMNYFVVDIADPHDYFQTAIELIQGKSIKILPKQREFFKNLAIILENTELLCYALDIATPNLTPTNAFSSLEEKSLYNLDISQEIEVIASSFYTYPLELLAQLDVNILMRILHSPNLTIESDHYLFDFIYQLASKDPKYIILFSAIQFQYLNEEDIHKFNQLVTFDQMNPLIWAAMKPRLQMEVPTVIFGGRYNRNITSCPYKGEMFNGIMDYLRTLHKGKNPVDVGAVAVTVNVKKCNVSARDLFERGTKPRWFLAEQENNWICLDFKGGKVAMDGYSWGSGSESSYWEYPVSFTWEGSEDNKTWTEIDKKDDNMDMGGNQKTHHWDCTKSNFFRYIRFRLRKVERTGGLYSTQLELFGQYLEPEKSKSKNGSD